MNLERLHVAGNKTHAADGRARGCVLFFAGWGMDAKPFAAWDWSQAHHDIWMASDWTNGLELDAIDGLLSTYERHALAAWSWGVPFALACAARAFERDLPHPASVTLIHGTPRPIDEACGIPLKIVQMTLESLSSGGLQRFYERAGMPVCVGGDGGNGFVPPARSLASVSAELVALLERFTADPAPGPGIDRIAREMPVRVFAGVRDRIIPIRAQRNAWRDVQPVFYQESDACHWAPDLIYRELLHAPV